jgi:hypothetical protein
MLMNDTKAKSQDDSITNVSDAATLKKHHLNQTVSSSELLDVPAVSMPKGKIHPVIIFPIGGRADNKDLVFLYNKFIALLAKDPEYARPITVMDFKTYYNNTKYKHDNNKDLRTEFLQFIHDTVKPHSELVRAWCVDTCQMWNTGLGAAFNDGGPGDIYWLIPGDFFYSQKPEVLEKIKKIPEAVQRHGQNFCIGEISVGVNSPKQLIDTYGTYGLLYNWFPHEAQAMRQKTDKPRSEFFAISGEFLEDVLRKRWYAYEQTIVILLHAITTGKTIHKVPLGDISDLEEGREKLAAAMQQVERTERVLKMVWRERNDQDAGWIDRFRLLDQQSGQVRGAALIILQNLLGVT